MERSFRARARKFALLGGWKEDEIMHDLGAKESGRSLWGNDCLAVACMFPPFSLETARIEGSTQAGRLAREQNLVNRRPESKE